MSSPRCFVSVPEERWVLRAPHDEAPESALIVPELPVERVRCFQCLVDDGGGGDLREHVVVWGTEAGPSARELLRHVLRLRRPVAVSFARPAPAGHVALDEVPERTPRSGNDTLGALLAAAVVGSTQGDRPRAEMNVLDPSGRAHVVHCVLERRVFSCRVVDRAD